MEDKRVIRQMSQKLSDGSFSEPRSFGVDGENVRMKDGSDLETRLKAMRELSKFLDRIFILDNEDNEYKTLLIDTNYWIEGDTLIPLERVKNNFKISEVEKRLEIKDNYELSDDGTTLILLHGE